MTSNIVNSMTPVEHVLTTRVIEVIAAYALLVLAGRRGWLKPNEVSGIGAAMIFWAAAWLFQIVVQIVRPRYPHEPQYVGISIALVLPILIAMILGLWFLVKRMKANPSTDTKQNTKKR